MPQQVPKLAVANNISKSGSVSFSNKIYNEAEILISKGISTEATTSGKFINNASRADFGVCFIAETKIALEDRNKPIEKIK
ncbi:hypothetical protein [Clostridium senegalense]|uniref:hypothetical protein n=1 Tax=Clostridium senegalense TaxID=1465809 RepID=UPI000289897E|nr:hypothetical protein [Clostridium senegalense]